ncbi:MAG: hypothetical protein WDN50_07875 [Bradyrhizobium sp.]
MIVPIHPDPIPEALPLCPEVTMQLRSQGNFFGGSTPPQRDDDIWRPVAQSLGSRDTALRSRYSSVGFIIDDDRVVNFESRPERFAAEAFALDPAIDWFVEQAEPIGYLDRGRLRHHTFDFFSTASGIRTLTAIKHSTMVARSGIRRTIQLISEQAGRRVADQIVLLTERDFSQNERFNAEQAHEIRRHPVPEHDQHVREIAHDINGTVTISDVVTLSGLRGDGFRAVVRLLADRFFQLAAPDTRVDYDARIRRR